MHVRFTKYESSYAEKFQERIILYFIIDKHFSDSILETMEPKVAEYKWIRQSKK
jgi:hypothetical protein